MFRIMTDIVNFQLEILKQFKSELMTKIRLDRERLTTLQSKVNWAVEQASKFALLPGQIPAEFTEPLPKNLNFAEITDDIVFSNMAMSYLEIRMEECQMRSQRKDPKTMAQMFQKMDHIRLTLYAVRSDQADLLIKRIRSATAAFAQVCDHIKKTKFTLLIILFYRMIWEQMNPFLIWSNTFRPRRNLCLPLRKLPERRPRMLVNESSREKLKRFVSRFEIKLFRFWSKVLNIKFLFL